VLDDPWVQFGLLIEVGDQVIGGSREGAAKLGFVLASPIRW